MLKTKGSERRQTTRDFSLTTDDLIELFESVARLYTDGHFTVFRFDTGYKVMIGTPDLDAGCHEVIWNMETHKTFPQAVIAELKRISRERKSIF